MMRCLAEFGPYMPMANRLILDTDGGVDDAQALLLLIANGRPPDAITTVFGDVSLEAATDRTTAGHPRRRRGAHRVACRLDVRPGGGEDGQHVVRRRLEGLPYTVVMASGARPAAISSSSAWASSTPPSLSRISRFAMGRVGSELRQPRVVHLAVC